MTSQDLSWTTHINTMVKKSNSVLGFLRRNPQVSNDHTKEAAYKTLVRPHLEYWCTVWNPHIKMVQRWVVSFTTWRYRNTSSVSEMLEHLSWETLETCGVKASLTMLHVYNHMTTYMTPGCSRARSSHAFKCRQFKCSQISFKAGPLW